MLQTLMTQLIQNLIGFLKTYLKVKGIIYFQLESFLLSFKTRNYITIIYPLISYKQKKTHHIKVTCLSGKNIFTHITQYYNSLNSC